jgi:hypothetical protein
MLSRSARIKRKVQLLEQLDSKHEIELERTFEEHLADAIRAGDPKEYRQKIAEATEVYEGALDSALYEILDNRFAEEDLTVA